MPDFRKTRMMSAVARAAQPLAFNEDIAEYSSLLAAIGDARLVLIGEASHGTHDFYRERARITRRLICDHGFSAVAVEADWPDAYRVNRFVLHESGDTDVLEALADFRRFPAWMWRNMDVVQFVTWLRGDNRGRHYQVGFYGLDLYSLYGSAQAVLRYLDRVDPAAAARARYRYSCFDQFGEDAQAYGYAVSFGMSPNCEQAAVDQLTEIQRRVFGENTGHANSAIFSAEQNARLVRNAEQYYRTMFGGRGNSWNLRDRHMMETLDRLLEHLGPGAKVVVWAHNSHIGDARATEMGQRGELNLGQLVREKYGDACFLLGFTTYCGEVTAASDWDEPAGRKIVRHALDGSWEALLHEAFAGDFLLLLRDAAVRDALPSSMLERAIGVVYRPETERISHYFQARLAEQFDAIIHIDRTRALIPLEKTTNWEHGEVPETYPFAV